MGCIKRAWALLASGDIWEIYRRIRMRWIGSGKISTVCCQSKQSQSSLSVSRPFGISTKPLRLLMFSHNLNLEGAPISLLELAVGLFEAGIVVPQIVSFLDGPLRRRYEHSGIQVITWPSYVEGVSTVGRLEEKTSALSEFIRSSNPDVVFANTLQTFISVLAANEVGIPCVFNVRESEPWQSCFGYLNNPVAERAVSAIMLSNEVVFVADATRRLWAQFDKRRSFRVIRNRLREDFRGGYGDDEARYELRAQRGWNDDAFVILCVGTACERKGQLDLVRALSIIADDLFERLRVCFVGDFDSDYGRSVRKEISSIGAFKSANFSIYPASEDIRPFYKSADVFVLCSRVESYPRVILEAMAFSLPIVTTPVFGVLEQVASDDALFYEPGDWAQLSKVLVKLATASELVKTMRDRSRLRYEALSPFDEMIQQYGQTIRTAHYASERADNCSRLA